VEIIASAPAQIGLSEIGGWASRMERIGFDVIHIAETIHDPFTIAVPNWLSSTAHPPIVGSWRTSALVNTF
jgi:hypothetical protein